MRRVLNLPLWFLVRVVSDPELVFHASLTSAQVLLPGSQASLSSLLLEGHSLLALAAIMFAPGGIDQVRLLLPGLSATSLTHLMDSGSLQQLDSFLLDPFCCRSVFFSDGWIMVNNRQSI